ncbi:MAG: rhamnan synthesis F family protein, partial [Chloroflexota bacterium]
MRIGIFGTFDVENYGDLLFPIIAERELKQRLENVEIIRYSYNEKNESSWYYNVTSLADLLNDSTSIQTLDCILIGGGHLLRFDKQVADQYKPTLAQIPHPTGYWLTPALAGITAGRPVIWNAPSSSNEFPAWSHGLLAYTLENSAYVSVRDILSFEALRRAGFEGECNVVPDTVFSLAGHFPSMDLRAQTEKLLSSIGVRKKYLVIQATSTLESVTRALFSEVDFSDFDILVLPIGPILGDDVSQVLQFLPQAKYLSDWPSPLEIAGIVAHSSGAIALSLHLSITALNYGLPVLRPMTARLPKYALLRSSENVYFGGPEDLDGITDFINAVRSNQPRLCSLVKETQSKLDVHWEKIAEICREHRSYRFSPVNDFAQANLLVTRQENLGNTMADLEGRAQMMAARITNQNANIFREGEIIKRHDTCVILHLYYPEMWNEISSSLSNFDKKFDLFVTIPHEVHISEQVIKANFPDALIHRCDNRGRDVAPFLAVFSAIAKLDYKYICKIHTKKSRHITNGGQWQEDMLQKLLGSPRTITQIKKAFDQHPNWGMIAPQGHVVPHDYFWQQNAANVIKLAHSVGLPTESINFSYVAGSMFWFRPEALSLFLNLGIVPNDFEPEQGQIDGTLAHAIERFFGMAVHYLGYLIAESDSQGVRLSEIGFQFKLLIQAFQQQEQTFTTQVT